MVARESASLYDEMVESEGWLERGTFTFDAIDLYMSKVNLHVNLPKLYQAQFFSIPSVSSWVSTLDEDEMPFEKALAIVSEEVSVHLATPSWAYKLPIKR